MASVDGGAPISVPGSGHRLSRSPPPGAPRPGPPGRPWPPPRCDPGRPAPAARRRGRAQRVASSSGTPTPRTSMRKARSMVMTLPASVPSSSSADLGVTTMGRPPSIARDPTGSPDAAGAVGDGHQPVGGLGLEGQPHDARVHVVAVADDFGRHLRGLEDGPDHARLAMRERRHAVEEVCGVGDPGRRWPPAPRRTWRRCGQWRRVCPASRNRRTRSRPPSSSGAMVTIATASWLAAMTRMMSSPENASGSGSCPAALAGLRRQCAGCAPFHAGLMKLLSRCAGSTRADPGIETTRAAAHREEERLQVGRVHATDVGQNAVTP
jgi:hypothetical protein